MHIQHNLLGLLRCFLLMTFVAAFAFVNNAYSQNVGQHSPQQQLDNFIKNVNSASGSFTQEKIDDTGNRTDEQQQGEFAFSRPGNFKWNITKPYEQLTLANQENLIQYDPDLEQVIIRDAKQSIGASPASILFGEGDLKQQFDISVVNEHPYDKDQKQTLNWLRAKPHGNDAGFDYVDIGFVKSDNETPQLSVILVKDGFGQTTLIKFADIKTNPKLSDTEFLFSPPDDVDVVKM